MHIFFRPWKICWKLLKELFKQRYRGQYIDVLSVFSSTVWSWCIWNGFFCLMHFRIDGRVVCLSAILCNVWRNYYHQYKYAHAHSHTNAPKCIYVYMYGMYYNCVPQPQTHLLSHITTKHIWWELHNWIYKYRKMRHMNIKQHQTNILNREYEHILWNES